MWTRTHSKVFHGITKESIWQLWTDVNKWPLWHGDLEYCTLEGPFVEGNHFMLKPKGIRAFKIILTEIKEGQKFTDCTQFFGAKMYDTHELDTTPDGVRLTNILTVTGPLKFLWIKLVAQNVADSVPQEMETLVELARSHS